MKNTLELQTPIEINGKEVTSLEYDATEITSEQFMQAASLAAAQTDMSKGAKIVLQQSDYNLHLNLGFMAIIAVNPQIDIMDLKRIKGFDIVQISSIGLLFTLGKSVETSESSNLEEQSEIIAETSIQV